MCCNAKIIILLNPKRDDASDYTLGGGYTNIEHFAGSLTR